MCCMLFRMRILLGTVQKRRAKVATARELRRRMTPEEVILWEELRSRRFRKFKFRRQVPVGRFVADFLCLSLHLIIEIDGGIHDDQQGHDKGREELLRKQGFRIIRCRNEEVQGNLPGALSRLEQEIFRKHS